MSDQGFQKVVQNEKETSCTMEEEYNHSCSDKFMFVKRTETNG